MLRKRLAIIICLAASIALPCRAQAPFGAVAQQPLDGAEKRAVVTRAGELLTANYVFPDRAAEAKAKIDAALASGDYDSITAPEAFAAKLTADLRSVTHDKHMRVFIPPSQPPADAAGTPAKPQTYAGFARVDHLKGNIGYIKLINFPDAAGPFIATANKALADLAGTDALIIDMRDNLGGRPESVAYLCSFFFDPKIPVHLNRFIDRKPGISEFSSRDFYTQPVPTPYLEKPVYLLTGKRTFSAGEEFIYDMQAQKRARLIGDSTGGGANPGGPRPLNSRFSIFIPTGRAENPVTKTNWEGAGVTPDAAVDEKLAFQAAMREITARDPAKYAALKAQIESESNEESFVEASLLNVREDPQTPNGDWNGTLELPDNGHLRMLFHFQETATGLQVVLNYVDLRKQTFPPGSAKLTGNSLTISIPALNGVYQGTLSGDHKTASGTWTQGRRSVPLSLVAGNITPLVLHQPEQGDLTISTSTGTLAGTILTAGDGKLAAVIISGAGPANRDGDSPINGGSGTYRDIAKGLAAQGVTTLRFDKRGVGQSAAAMRREEDLRVQTSGDDVRAWAAELKQRTGASCVWLIGHSEGAFLAELAADGNRDICGIVILAGVGIGFYENWRDAMERIVPKDQMAAVVAVLDSLQAGKPVSNPPSVMMGAFRPSIQAYMMSEFAVNPAALLGRLKIPVLILQGDADQNVSVADARALAAARPDATLKILPGVDHSQRIAKDDPGRGPGPLATGVTESIADFMKAHI